MVLGIYAFADFAADGAPHLNTAAGEELFRVERAAAVALGSRAPEPPGTLFITTRRVIWVSEVEKGKGYAVDFHAVSRHHVSRDREFPSPCICTQIDKEVGESDESDFIEMRIIPSDPCRLDALFGAFSHCAELNPNPHADEGDEDMTGGSDAECEFSDVSPIGQTDDHDITVVEINDQRFEDAEEAEHETHGNGH